MTAATSITTDQTSVAARRLARAMAPTALAVLVALVIGGLLIAWAGENPFRVYRLVLTESILARTGWRDTLSKATPLILIGLGLAVGFQASIWNIGAEGQFVAGATAAMAILGTAQPPTVVAIPLGILLAAIGGAAWAALAALLIVRFNVNDVIATLLLAFTAVPLLNWVAREPLKDPESFLPQSRVIGTAELPDLPWIDTHIGILIALAFVALLAWLLPTTRIGYIVRAHGHNRTAIYANESRRPIIILGLLMTGGGLAGIAGYVVLAGEQIRLSGGSAAGFGFTAIIVAILGRNRPLGVLGAAIALSALLVGAEAAQRQTGIPVTLMQSVQALIVICVVSGNTIAARRGATGGAR